MGIKYVNNSEGTLAAGISAAALTLSVQAGEGIKFPTIVAASGDYFYCTLVDISGNREVIKVTEHQAGTDVFQVIERAADAIQNGTPTAYAFLASDKVQCRLPAAAIMAPDATTSDIFHIDSDNTGPKLKNSAGELQVRNATDAAYANLQALGLTLNAALVVAGSVTGVTSLTMAGALSGVTTLAIGGALTGATDITASGTVQAEHLYSTDDAVIDDDLTVSGLATVVGTSSIPIDNEATGKSIKARDHGTGSVDEVVNVCYGTGAPPTATTTTIGTLFVKYI